MTQRTAISRLYPTRSDWMSLLYPIISHYIPIISLFPMDPINSKGQITSQIIPQLAVPQKGWIHRGYHLNIRLSRFRECPLVNKEGLTSSHYSIMDIQYYQWLTPINQKNHCWPWFIPLLTIINHVFPNCFFPYRYMMILSSRAFRLKLQASIWAAQRWDLGTGQPEMERMTVCYWKWQ